MTEFKSIKELKQRIIHNCNCESCYEWMLKVEQTQAIIKLIKSMKCVKFINLNAEEMISRKELIKTLKGET